MTTTEEPAAAVEAPPQRLAASAYALIYASILPGLQKIAREHGYALAVHGSMQTDLDLIAAPWTEEAAEAEVLIEAIREEFHGEITHDCPREKPHGRRAWSILAPWAFDDAAQSWCFIKRTYLDISVFPKGGVQ